MFNNHLEREEKCRYLLYGDGAQESVFITSIPHIIALYWPLVHITMTSGITISMASEFLHRRILNELFTSRSYSNQAENTDKYQLLNCLWAETT